MSGKDHRKMVIGKNELHSQVVPGTDACIVALKIFTRTLFSCFVFLFLLVSLAV